MRPHVPDLSLFKNRGLAFCSRCGCHTWLNEKNYDGMWWREGFNQNDENRAHDDCDIEVIRQVLKE
jgi:hypothetical protein